MRKTTNIPPSFSRTALWILGCLVSTVLFLGMQGSASADRLTYIFDASGSMWGQIDGKAKISIAKTALSDLIQKIPAGTKVSLVAYGHRRKGDCADIEELVPMGPLNPSALISAVKKIKPKGKTPMADSIQRVADSLRSGNDPASIILISDGKETCNPDPCAMVRSLKDSGIAFTLHVIGFAVDGKTEQQLRCMADAGGGMYFPADSASAFQAAATTSLAQTTNNLLVSAERNGKPIAVDVFVSSAGETGVLGNMPSTEKTPAAFKVEPGTYDIRVVDAWGQEGTPEQTVRGVEVAKDEPRRVKVAFGGGVLTVWTLRNGKPFHADVSVRDAAGKSISKQTGEDRPARFELAGGTYAVSAKDEWGSGVTLALGSVTVGAEETKLEARFDLGSLDMWAYRSGKPYVADVYVIDAAGNTVENMATRADQVARFELLPGTYTVRIKDEWGDGSSYEKNVVIEGGKITEWKFNFDAP